MLFSCEEMYYVSSEESGDREYSRESKAIGNQGLYILMHI